MNDYVPLQVYRGLHYFLSYRSLELVDGSFVTKTRKLKSRPKPIEIKLPAALIPETEPEAEPETEPEPNPKEPKRLGTWLEPDKFIDLIQWERYCVVEARDMSIKIRRFAKHHQAQEKTKTFIIILDKDYEINSADLSKILLRLPDITAKVRKFNTDVIIISEWLLPVHPKKKMDQFEFPGSETAGYISMSNHLYTLFTFDMFARDTMPPHRILDQTEEDEVLTELRIVKSQLEKLSNDVVAFLLGAVSGDLVEIIPYNENTATELHYRVVR